MDWQTPPALFQQMNERYSFTYDAFASHKNTKVGYYSTVEGTFSDRGRGKLNDSDGLTSIWSNERVFMNPPYARGLIDKCVQKAYEERNEAAIIVALLPASVGTHWFNQIILPNCWVHFLDKRVKFINPETGVPGDSPPTGHVIATFKRDYQV